jgi:hypothetical protein
MYALREISINSRFGGVVGYHVRLTSHRLRARKVPSSNLG